MLVVAEAQSYFLNSTFRRAGNVTLMDNDELNVK